MAEELEDNINTNNRSKGEIYFDERMPKYGISSVDDELNQVELWQYDAEARKNVLKKFPIFYPVDKGIAIRIYTIDRSIVRHDPGAKLGDDGEEVIKRGWKQDYVITRLHTVKVNEKTGKEQKYDIPKGGGTFPFFTPEILRKFDNKTKIKTLVMTEGHFKAWEGSRSGMDIVSLSSITHFKDSTTGGLHSDILKLIRTCNVENVIWLADGDCNRISLKALESGDDIYKRPNSFFSSCSTIRKLLSDQNINIFFAYTDSLRIEGMPKGIDDLLQALPEEHARITEDLVELGRPSKYFYREDMTYNAGKIYKHFHLNDVTLFWEFHTEQMAEMARLQGADFNLENIRRKPFKFNGTSYQYDAEKNLCKIIVPADAGRYFRVGDQYHEKVEIPNKWGDLEKTFHLRQKQTIVDDYGKELLTHIPKYKAFCNVPNHSNYQQVISNCYNMYYPFEHLEEEGECPTTLKYLEHIFGKGEVVVKHPTKGELRVKELDLGLDYISLLYLQPQQILPILCLASKENSTGKSTLGSWLKLLFTQNVAVVGNADLANEFNKSWAGKLIIICDEAKIDKNVVVERIKSLSTANKIFMNGKGKDQVEIDFFGKFILLTNNEENFIYAGDEDVRYWVRKVPVITELLVDMLGEMKEEIPAFLHFIAKRKMATENLFRAWFFPELIKTEALKKVVAFSKSTVEKEFRHNIREMFFDFGLTKIMLSLDDIKEDMFKSKYEKNYLKHVIQEQIKADQYHIWEYEGKFYQSLGQIESEVGESFNFMNARKRYKVRRYQYPRWEMVFEGNSRKRTSTYVNGHGRPYIFRVEDFLTKAEIEGRWINPEQEASVRSLERDLERDEDLNVKADPHVSLAGKQEDLPF